ncbi:hypothetical protein PF005_g2726 [Phytophthora fragariae]|uniref:Uncharacterized protein n=1 Tax=Phytophthora fragariae TaxID=53985 RepID=A0A6A3MBJ0_9STRA|nr:hypothetical protein PF003_g20023 [Phytophthora fragariae]KAE8947663.1 hypothetical protein PF009_g2724 [Phytophthora fragariae]KAE9027250.1 hypothetical protein PF011_g2124 [Phytophthora fragariae]KAE9135155.1 hypothetical protein PF010_g2161 [Phytophthora fragariae]KAE9135388.1 hypothetical protein PF007_g2554 [Phytophthora fragariae]
MMSPSPTPSLDLAQRTIAAPPTLLTSWTPSPQLTQDDVVTTASPPIPSAMNRPEYRSDPNSSLSSACSGFATTEQGIAELVAEAVEHACMLDTALASSTSTIKKGKNFVPDEDLMLAAAWREVSGGPVVGNE